MIIGTARECRGEQPDAPQAREFGHEKLVSSKPAQAAAVQRPNGLFEVGNLLNVRARPFPRRHQEQHHRALGPEQAAAASRRYRYIVHLA